MANNPDILKKLVGTVELTDRLERSILTKLNWSKCKGRAEPSPQFLLEEKFTFQRAISTAVSCDDIPYLLVLNVDQTPWHTYLQENTLLVPKVQKCPNQRCRLQVADNSNFCSEFNRKLFTNAIDLYWQNLALLT